MMQVNKKAARPKPRGCEFHRLRYVLAATATANETEHHGSHSE